MKLFYYHFNKVESRVKYSIVIIIKENNSSIWGNNVKNRDKFFVNNKIDEKYIYIY